MYYLYIIYANFLINTCFCDKYLTTCTRHCKTLAFSDQSYKLSIIHDKNGSLDFYQFVLINKLKLPSKNLVIKRQNSILLTFN